VELSLGAELLMLAVDPTDGGLLPHNRRRLLKALAAADDGAGGGRLAGRRARRRALDELRAASVVDDAGALRRARLTDPARARRRFADLVRGMTENELNDGRDRELLLLLAWIGALAGRLSKSERRLAARRLHAWGQAADEALQPEGGAPQPSSDAYGAIAALGGMTALSVAAYDGFGPTDSGAAHGGGHDGGAGHDHGGGGHHHG
jgi:hypothetical protein